MKSKYLFSVLLIGLLWACGSENPTDEVDSDAINKNQIVDEAENEWETIKINDGGFLTFTTPISFPSLSFLRNGYTESI